MKYCVSDQSFVDIDVLILWLINRLSTDIAVYLKVFVFGGDMDQAAFKFDRVGNEKQDLFFRRWLPLDCQNHLLRCVIAHSERNLKQNQTRSLTFALYTQYRRGRTNLLLLFNT